MDKQKAYKDKVSAEIDEHAVKLTALKAKLKSEAADAKVSSMEKIREIEGKLSYVKEKLV